MSGKHAPCDRFRAAQYSVAAHLNTQFPADQGYEVAFVGRSNAGKSSVINSITNQKNLAHTSKTPGRTQQIVFFRIDDQRRLVDLPGYGHAKVDKALKDHWIELMDSYFSTRTSLQGVVIIMDIRHPLRDTDWQMLEWSRSARVPAVLVLNKCDKLSKNEIISTIRTVVAEVEAAKLENVVTQRFSSLKKEGHQELCSAVTPWLHW